MRVLVVQYSGDFRAAAERLEATGQETYHGHRYLLDCLEKWKSRFEAVGILCCLTPQQYHEQLPNGVEVLGAGAHPLRESRRVLRAIAEWRPTHLIVMGPITPVLKWGVRHSCQVLSIMANSFVDRPWKLAIKYCGLRRTLNGPGVAWVANHGVNACRSLISFGVTRSKVLPWDWPQRQSEGQYATRELTPPYSLLYVGLVSAEKGVGDLIRGFAKAREAGSDVELRVAGAGSVDEFRKLAEELDVADHVEFMGVLANDQVLEVMCDATAVVVPSRREYPEGLPLVIYEALLTRTPIIASDHPMFAGHLRHGETALMFSERNVDQIAARIAALLHEPTLYRALSAASEGAWRRMQNPVKWGDLISHWLEGDRGWVANRVIDKVAPDGALAMMDVS